MANLADLMLASAFAMAASEAGMRPHGSGFAHREQSLAERDAAINAANAKRARRAAKRAAHPGPAVPSATVEG